MNRLCGVPCRSFMRPASGSQMTVDSTQPRTEPITDEERLFDLIPAAWRMDDCTFEKVAGLPEGWMWKWRNHYLAPPSSS